VVTGKVVVIPGTVVMPGTGAMSGVVDIDQQLRLATPNNRVWTPPSSSDSRKC
jgi:hypothetical protein